MATVTCGCGTELTLNDLVCPSCRRRRPKGSGSLAPVPDSDRSPTPEQRREASSAVAACDHAAAQPGAITCPDCGAKLGGRRTQPQPSPRRFRLRTPWDDLLEVESEIEIGRDVGPLAKALTGRMTVSRRHAILCVTPSGRLHVIDQGSSNGTFRNDDDEPIDPHSRTELRAGDTVSFSRGLRFVVEVVEGEVDQSCA